MFFKKITPAITVEDIKTAIKFYADLLGFKLILAIPSMEHVDWALMQCGEVEIMFHAKVERSAKHRCEEAGPLTFHLEAEGVRALYDSIKTSVKIVRHLYPTFYGTTEFSIMDCNGVMLVFSEKNKKDE